MKKPRKKRSTKWKNIYYKQARVACMEYGATDSDLAKLFGVDRTTIHKWMRQRKTFERCIRRGRDKFNTNKVERALKLRAIGYTYDEVTKRQIKFKHIKDRKTQPLPAIEVTTTTKRIQPDVMACMFWLQNRARNRWKNVNRIETSNTTSVQHDHLYKLELDLTKLEDKDLETMRRIIESTNAQSSGNRLPLAPQKVIDVHSKEVAKH